MTTPWHKLGYRLVTTAALSAAAVGVALPLLPTAPFLLLAAWSASHHSPRLEARLLANPRVGPHIRAWRRERALSRQAKRAALVTLGLSLAFSLVVLDAWAVKLVVVAVVSAVAGFLVTRPVPSGSPRETGSCV